MQMLRNISQGAKLSCVVCVLKCVLTSSYLLRNPSKSCAATRYGDYEVTDTSCVRTHGVLLSSSLTRYGEYGGCLLSALVRTS